MQAEVWEIVQGWALAMLVYPGLLFGALLALIGEWIVSVAQSSFRRTPRAQMRPRAFLHPLNSVVKLAGRRAAAPLPTMGDAPTQNVVTSEGILSLLCVVAPVLALALIPLPANPLLAVATVGDFITVLALLAVGPLARAVRHMQAGGLLQVRGAQGIGRVLVGLVPALVAVAALVEVSGSRSLQLASVTAAPETWSQTVVRLLAGAVLLLSLPWWLDGREQSEIARENAGTLTGRYLQAAALAAFWSAVVLPVAGELAWAIVIALLGTLFAYVVMRLYHRLLPARREKDVASLAWATSLPVAALALVVALFWPGA